MITLLAYKSTFDIITHFEGCNLTGYRDSGGILTIGYGHTKGPIEEGVSITQEEANLLLAADIEDAWKRVISVIDKPIYAKLNYHNKAALISQAFNLRSFEKLAKYLNTDQDLYLRKTLLYCHVSGGGKLNGLLIRRICERLLFTGKPWMDVAKDLQLKRDIDYTECRKVALFES